MESLTKLYKKEKLKLTSGSSPSTWKYFNNMNELLGSLPAQDDNLMEESVSVEDQIQNIICNNDDSVLSITFEEPSTSSSFSTPEQTGSCSAGRKRKRNSQSVEVLENMTEIMNDIKKIMVEESNKSKVMK